ncbi:Polygalacturonase [Camellia lanceoleosa]|uniref:Polygalacturonase n=1 Tax=Camellia lanceoleosa TaxID=1840588 RepID=A0ACC0GKY9_9ERIC|nr:Polygalacturonase [Camellia lanceoleosa]
MQIADFLRSNKEYKCAWLRRRAGIGVLGSGTDGMMVVCLVTDNGNYYGGTSYNSSTGIFYVRKFGAVGDGITDDTEAFKTASDMACLFESGVLLVPYSYSLMIQSTIFTVPCQSGFRINEISLQGGGLIDGRGKKWWDLPCRPHKGANRTTLSGPCYSPIVSESLCLISLLDSHSNH